MGNAHWLDVIALLKGVGLEFDSGLTDLELEIAEKKFNFRFPPDLRAFLHTALPTGKHFPNWRSGDETEIRERLGWPLHGCLLIWSTATSGSLSGERDRRCCRM